MRQIDLTSAPDQRRLYWSALRVGLATIVTSQSALGHALLFSRGKVVVDQCQASFELEIAAEDFVHWYGIRPDAEGSISMRSLQDAAERHALALHRIVVIRDAAGNELMSQPFQAILDVPRLEFIQWEEFVRCLCLGQEEVRPIKYDPKARRYHPELEFLPAAVHQRVVNDSLTLVRALGYDMNSMEWAIRDGIPYAIDFMNPAPDMDVYSLTPVHFEWVVARMADMAIRLAKEMGPGHTIVTILCDYGTRYQSKLFNPEFLRSKNLPVPGWLERDGGLKDVLARVMA